MKNDSELNDWLKVHAKDSGQKIADSAAFVSIFTKNYLDNPLCALQLGYAILLNKPICLVVEKGTPVPRALTRLADCIETVNMDEPSGMVRAQGAITKFLQGVDRGT